MESGARAKPQMDWKLKAGNPYIEITSFCNLSCDYCYNDSGAASKKYLSRETIRAIVNQLEPHAKITLSGGEPFLHPDIWDIIEDIQQTKHALLLISNASVLTMEQVDWLLRHQIVLQITFDSIDSDCHDRQRARGNFNQLMEIVSHARKIGCMQYLLVRINLHKEDSIPISQILDFFDRQGVERLKLSYIFAHGRAQKNHKSYEMGDEYADIIRILREFKQAEMQIKGKMRIDFGDFAEGLACPFLNNGEILYNPRIDPEGDVYLCQQFVDKSLSIGNVYNATLRELTGSASCQHIMEGMRAFKDHREKCRLCFLKPHCWGGCPALRYAQQGNFAVNDDQCMLYRYKMKAILMNQV